MSRYLVVAHRTLGGRHLFDHLAELREADPECGFHVLVPQYHPRELIWSDGTTHAIARELLDHMLDELSSRGIDATGEVGSANPVTAVGETFEREGAATFVGIVLSTLPRGASRWWRSDVPGKIARRYPTPPLTHLVAEEAASG